MRDRYIPALITLLAGAITCIIDIYRKAELLPSLKRLLVVLIIFYIIGLISRAIIRKVLEPKLESSDNEIGDNPEDATDDEDANTNENTDDKEEVAKANDSKVNL